MKTKMTRVGDTVVVSMDGKLNFGIEQPLKENLGKLIEGARTDSVPKKIIFNLENLEFVGSSGISSFVQTLKDFSHQAPTKPRFCNVGSEFQRVMKAFDEEEEFKFYDNEDKARSSFDH